MDLPGHTTWAPDLALHSYRCSIPDCCPRESKMQTAQGQTTTLSTSDRGGGGGKKKKVGRSLEDGEAVEPLIKED